MFDVFEAFINTDNIQVFANAATDYIMCLMKFVKGLGLSHLYMLFFQFQIFLLEAFRDFIFFWNVALNCVFVVSFFFFSFYYSSSSCRNIRDLLYHLGSLLLCTVTQSDGLSVCRRGGL